MSPSPRLIDKLPVTPREREMKVLALGCSRTGTDSLKTALNQLGYNSYHMFEVLTDKHGQYWIEAMDANFSHKLKPYGREEFDKLLWKYDTVTDMPMALFVDDLWAAYPDTKVVLTNRDVESWMDSLHKTLFPMVTSRVWDMLYPFDSRGVGAVRTSGKRSFVELAKGDFMDRAKLRQGYLDHYAHVRAVVPKERLLEFKSQDGWEPLCKFLGKEIPANPYPRTNDATSHNKLMKLIFVLKCLEAVGKILLYGGGMGAIVGVMWYYWQRGVRYRA